MSLKKYYKRHFAAGETLKLQLTVCGNCNTVTDASGEFLPCCGEPTDESPPYAVLDGFFTIDAVRYDDGRNSPNEI